MCVGVPLCLGASLVHRCVALCVGVSLVCRRIPVV